MDVNGYYGPAPQFGPAAALHPLAGERIASSRDGIGGWTGPFAAGTTRSIDPVASLDVAPEATAVTVNVTALNAQAPGFATVYPCGGTRPEVSSVNVAPGSVATNLVTVDLAGDRTLCFYTSTGVDLIVDLFGVMAAPTGSLVERLSFDGVTWPPFTPTATDYAVECGTDGEETIDLETVADVTARVNGLVVNPSRIPLAADVDQLTHGRSPSRRRARRLLVPVPAARLPAAERHADRAHLAGLVPHDVVGARPPRRPASSGSP